MTQSRNLGPDASWVLERDSLAERLVANRSLVNDLDWRKRVALLPYCYGDSFDDRLASVIRRAIELTDAAPEPDGFEAWQAAEAPPFRSYAHGGRAV